MALNMAWDNVVTKLCEEIYGKWHEIIFDNLFTGIDVAEERGDVIAMKKGPLLAVTWIDNKAVHLISTISQPQEGTAEVKRSKTSHVHLWFKSTTLTWVVLTGMIS